ncbi:putative ABC transport system permease protein [Butyrivibrio proteoclasticus]|uniref:Putative ABC transport system permease protein n=1 Tax=Butyrivibrio proteoclasticus TaxID=43305 RepID=A0A1I5QZN0_9FIRM|nr:ABC transporter permease [Butyrivibrio proteoclasticus]SFP51557.1 putative ABC transport system permease protein [Butyrivibrio proteoclasticus]
MLKTWLVDALRNIKVRIVSWLSIVTIVFIGTTLILGLYFGSSTVKKASTSYIATQNFKDYDISCSMGIKNDEIDFLKTLDEVNDAEGQISFMGELSLDDKSTGVTVISSTEKISTPTVTTGSLPSSLDECIVSYSAMKKIGAKIGDEIEISIASVRFDGILPNKTYKITGIASHPDYMVNISTDYIVLPLSCFDTSKLSFDYSNILIDANIPEDTFKSAYKKKSAEIKDILESETVSMSANRIVNLHSELDKEYANAQSTSKDELSKAKNELDKGLKTFTDAIETARSTLENGEEELNNIKSAAEKELSEAKSKIRSGEEEYNTMVADGQAQLEQAEKDMEKELNDAKFKLFDAFLSLDAAEKLLKEKEAEYSKGLEKLVEGKEKLDNGYKEYNEAIRQADEKVNDDIIDAAIIILELEEDSEETIEKLNNAKGKETLERCGLLIDAYDNAPPHIQELFDDSLDIDDFKADYDKLLKGKYELEEGQKKYDDGVEQLEEARKMLDQGWYDLQKGWQQYEDGKAELAKREPEAKKRLEDAKAEYEQKKAEGAAQLEDAKKTLSSKMSEATETIKGLEEQLQIAKDEYASQKEEGEKSINEATSQYESAKKEADDKLSDLKQQIDTAKATPCTYMVQTRDVNFPYVQTKSYMKAINGFFTAFTPLYAGIIAIVCFFTMTIIIEEQTSQIGTCKAFGMFESEIMRKYIIFGVSAALIGALLGVAGSFTIEKLLINTMKENLAFSLDGTGHNIVMIILLPLMEVLVTTLAVILSCHRYIHCSAVGLISGNEPASKYGKKAGKSFAKGIYLKLIVRNLFTDIGREVVSVVITVICVFIVGFGIDIKLAYEGALGRQMNDIWQYDLTLTESSSITDEEKAVITKALSEYDTLYLPVSVSVIIDDDSQILTNTICVDDSKEFDRFYILKDEFGKRIEIPDNGVLITKEMEEKNEISKGSSLHMISGNLRYSEVTVSGTFMLYAGKTTIMTSKYYEDNFGSLPTRNTYYIKAPGDKAKELTDTLSKLPGVSTVDLKKNLRDGNMAVVSLYNTVVAIVIIFSIMLTFMILLNLSNILVAHRMRELLTMRVNGFYNSQVIGYLVREVLLTSILSVVIALSLGVPLTGIIIKNLETDAFMFVRSPFVLAWASSVLINALFSVVINTIAFRKINTVPLTSITRY